MSINRLRNVAVRMRPKANAVEPEPVAPEPSVDPAPDLPPAHPTSRPTQPHHLEASRPEAPSRRQIWDLEGEDPSGAVEETDEGDAAILSRAAAHMPEAPAAPAMSPAAPAPDPQPNAGASRAKTRILGFHAQETTAALDEEAAAPAPGPVYPAGFLVVVEGPGRGAFFAVTTRVSAIGRGTDQAISLDFGDESISREGHASVMYDAEQNRFFLGHGNKANVVRRNGNPVLATEEMAHGDMIRIGKTTLRFHAFCGADFTWDLDDDDGDAHHG